MNKLLLSCDWGTSTFRLRLVDLDTHLILSEVLSDEGISVTYEAWEKNGEVSPVPRPEFYTNKLLQQIGKLPGYNRKTLHQVPLVISGMASSSLGLADLAYAPLPFDIDGQGLVVEVSESNPAFPHPIYLISGIMSHTDVMRGEETQLIGVIELLKPVLPDIEKESILLFPGTHSKHIVVKERKIVNFYTYITGELFALMSRKSILQGSVAVPEPGHVQNEEEREAFRQGVHQSRDGNLLSTLFRVRTNNLFGIFDKPSSYYYLSGLLIGTELRELAAYHQGQQLVLCSSSHLYELYRAAFEALNIPVKLIPGEMMEQTVIKGQIRIFQDLILSKSI